MLQLRRARVPLAVLAPGFEDGPVDPIEPSVVCDITVENGGILRVEPSDTGVAVAGDRDGQRDLAGAIVVPGFVDAHVHLDKTHTWFRAPNRSGTFAEALEVLWQDKENWSEDDLLRRASFALGCAWAHGTRVMRTHVDSGFPGAATSHGVMARLREQWRGRIELQTVPLCRIDEYATPRGEAIADLAIEHGAAALGGMPLMSGELPRQLDRLLALARERGVGLDFHVDESGNAEAACLRAVADAVLRNGFEYPVVCGHCCSLAVQGEEQQRATIDLVKAAGIAVISLPLCNLYLQDRRGNGFPRTPHWRGLTLIQDLLDAGVPVACASDNVRDAFHAHGDYSMLEVYTQSVRLAHLDGRLGDSLRVVTVAAADIVGRREYGRITPGLPAQLLVFAARSHSELLSRMQTPTHFVDGETICVPELPDFRELMDLA